MLPLPSLILLSPLLIPSTLATNLFVAASDGTLTTLSLNTNTSGSSLTVAHNNTQCGPNSAALNLDYTNRILYCLDRGSSTSTNGSMNSFSVSETGNLSRIARIDAPLSGVKDLIFGEEGKRGIATVSYNRSAISIIGLGEQGALTGPLQIIFPSPPSPAGPIPTRQELSYMHDVLLDPSKNFQWDKETLAPITELASLITDPGTGPRHGVFWTSPEGELYYFFVGELSQLVVSYKISYLGGEEGLSWSNIFSIPALGPDNAKPILTAPPSEIALTPDNRFLIVSDRDISFSNSTQYRTGLTDTLSTFTLHPNGTLSLLQLAPSGGYQPRQFSINKAGDKIAVGHQTNRTVVIWEREVESGLIKVGEPLGTVLLSGSVVATIWDEDMEEV